MGLLSIVLTLTLASAPPPTVDPSLDLCTPPMYAAQVETCPSLGPGAYQAQYANASAPADPSPLPTQKLPRPEKILSRTYARVITPDAPLFATPEEAGAGILTGSLGKGFIFVQLRNTAQIGDLPLYQIRGGDYIRAGDVQEIQPTTFQGLGFTANPANPFGWLVANVKPSLRPGAEPQSTTQRLARYQPVQVFGAVQAGRWAWYQIGPGQWVEQRSIAVVNLHAPPDGVAGKWIQVDLYEQTLAAYEDDQLIYATLVSSGLDKWATRPGLFQVYSRLEATRMRGAYEPDKSDYYYLEDVPWTMFFDGDRALHGEYWHDRLGFKRSHGCVNLAPLDARWLFSWTPKGAWVWVYDPSGRTQDDGAVVEGP